MKLFRKILFWCHLTTGVVVGVVVLVMSATGVLLTYQRQITAWADTRGMQAGPPSPGVAPMPIETLLAGVRQTIPARPTAITWRIEFDQPVRLQYGRERTVFVNAYTGVVLGEGSAGVRRFFRVVTDWHRWLAMGGERRAVGKAITGASNLAFLFLVLSGACLWWPRNWSRRAVRNVTLFRGGLRGKARDFNWHNVIGLWSVVPLGIVVASGVVISYRWANAAVYRAVGDTPPPAASSARPEGGSGSGPAGGPTAGAPTNPRRPGVRAGAALDGLDALLLRAGRRVPGWQSLTLAVPATVDAPVTFTIDRGTGGEPHKIARLTLERGTARELTFEGFAAQSPGRRARALLRFAHTGEVLGVFGQTLAGLVSLGGVVLVYTGLALSLRRLAHWRARRARAAAEGQAPQLQGPRAEPATP